MSGQMIAAGEGCKGQIYNKSHYNIIICTSIILHMYQVGNIIIKSKFRTENDPGCVIFAIRP